MAQYTELLAFAQFGSDLDKATKAQLNRGEKIREILKQSQYGPYPVEEQVVSFFAVTKGYLDDIEKEEVLNFEKELLKNMRDNSDILSKIKEKKTLDDQLTKEMSDFIINFKNHFEQ